MGCHISLVSGLLSHYSKDHYRLELEHNYITKSGQTWSQDRRCVECFVNIPIREDYLQHIGVEHRRVEQFLPTKYKLPPDAVKVNKVCSSKSVYLYKSPYTLKVYRFTYAHLASHSNKFFFTFYLIILLY